MSGRMRDLGRLISAHYTAAPRLYSASNDNATHHRNDVPPLSSEYDIDLSTAKGDNGPSASKRESLEAGEGDGLDYIERQFFESALDIEHRLQPPHSNTGGTRSELGTGLRGGDALEAGEGDGFGYIERQFFESALDIQCKTPMSSIRTDTADYARPDSTFSIRETTGRSAPMSTAHDTGEGDGRDYIEKQFFGSALDIEAKNSGRK